MHTQRDRQLDIRGAVGTPDNDQIGTVFGFGKNLMDMDAQQRRADNCQVHTAILIFDGSR